MEPMPITTVDSCLRLQSLSLWNMGMECACAQSIIILFAERWPHLPSSNWIQTSWKGDIIKTLSSEWACFRQMNRSDMKLEVCSQSSQKLQDTLCHDTDFNYALTFSTMIWHFTLCHLLISSLPLIPFVKYELCCAPSISAKILLFTALIIFV